MQLQQSYLYCQKLAQQHYENFPVASRFLAKELRNPIIAIYAFARTADDFADEGEFSAQQRLQLLANYHQELIHIQQSKNPIFIALNDVIQKFQLPLSLFQQLIEAFEQDITTNNYGNFKQLHNYCKKSANPVGRLLLFLNKQNNVANFQLSDHICTALQLINFLQDMQQDAIESQRLYIPLEDIKTFNLDANTLIKRIKSGQSFNKNEYLLFKQQILRAEDLLLNGQDLISQLSGRFKFEIALIVNSALRIVYKLKQSKRFSSRPRLNSWDKLTVFYKAIISIT